MHLRHVIINFSRELELKYKFDRNYTSDFCFHSRYICNYLTRKLRQSKYQTDGTYNMICIELSDGTPRPPYIFVTETLIVQVPFTPERYESIRGSDNCDYYLELIETGFRLVSTFKHIPLEVLMTPLLQFKEEGCQNRWIHKSKRYRPYNLGMALQCSFTTNDFSVTVVYTRLSDGHEYCRGQVIRTMPDEIFADGMYKDIKIVGDEVVITNRYYPPIFRFKLTDILSGIYHCHISDAPYIDPEQRMVYYNIIEHLFYTGNELTVCKTKE